MCSGCGVVLLLLLCSICIAFAGGGGDTIMSAYDGLMAGDLPAATVGFVPNVVFGWDVGLIL